MILNNLVALKVFTGTHQSLLESNDYYQAMVANQKTAGLAEGV